MNYRLVFKIVICILLSKLVASISVVEDCVKDFNSKICVDKRGFYYLLGNGTWNISFTEGDTIAERKQFLSNLERSNCRDGILRKMENDYCYCALGFPLPRHPITNGLIRPSGLLCKGIINQFYHGDSFWHPTKRDLELCKFQGSVDLAFLCVTWNNLVEMGHVYNNPRLLAETSDYARIRRNRTNLSWRNTTATAVRAEMNQTNSLKSRKPSANIHSNNQFDMNETQSHTHVLIQSKLLSEMYFRLHSDNDTKMDHVFVERNPINNQTISFSAPTECLSKHRKWDVFPLCSYSIDVSSITECQDLRVAFRVSSAVIFEHMADLNGNVIEEPSWSAYMAKVGNDSRSEDDSKLTCNDYPSHLSAVEVWVEGKHIASILSFTTVAKVSLERERLKVTGETGQKIVSKKEYTSLSRFWAKFHFGDCLYRQCWRDLWNVIPSDMLESSYSLVGTENDGYLQLCIFMPVCILCFVLLVRNFINTEGIESIE